jgi:hypothetical protein
MGHDDDTWKLAAALLTKHGIGAFNEAKGRAKAALDAKDTLGHNVWIGVAKAVLELLRPAGEEDPVN